MKFKDKRLLIINSIAGAIIVGAAFTFVKVSLARPHVELCSARYNRGMIMGLEENGTPITPSVIQSSAYGHDRGVIDNMSIQQLPKAPSKYVMSIDVSTNRPTSDGAPYPGVIFPWSPLSLEGAEAACLTYDVYIPDDFALADGLTLPGLYAVTKGSDFAAKTRVDTRVKLNDTGVTQMNISAKSASGSGNDDWDLYDRRLPRGRWVRVEQELVLNAPGKQNGIVRLWFNGELEMDTKDADLRDDGEVALSGVAGVVERRGRPRKPGEPAKTVVHISPFQLRWN